MLRSPSNNIAPKGLEHLGIHSINISPMVNQSTADLADTLTDSESAVSNEILAKITALDGVLSARCM